MTKKIVYVVVGDIGPAKELLLVMSVLERKYDIRVNWFVDSNPKAKAGEVLRGAGIPFQISWPIPEDSPALIIYGTSDYGFEAQMMWIAFGRLRHIKVIGIEDTWGTGEVEQARWLSSDLMLVADEAAAQIVKNVYPSLDVKVVGNPMFEEFLDLVGHSLSIRSAVRRNVGLNDSDFLAVVSLGGDNYGWFWLKEMIKRASDFEGTIFAWRFHPKDPDKDKLWEEAIASRIKHVDARSIDMDELCLAANVVMANYDNTAPFKALFAGIAVITLLRDDLEERIAMGYPEGVPPILSTDVYWGAKSVSEVITLLQEVKQDEKAVREYTRTVRAKPFLPLFKIGAAERIADEIAKHL